MPDDFNITQRILNDALSRIDRDVCAAVAALGRLMEERDKRYVTSMEERDKRYDERDKRYEQRFVDSATAVNAALSAAEKAVVKAEASSEKRFESVNEFRSTLADQQRTLMPRSEADLRMGTIENALGVLNKTNAEASGMSAGSKDTYGWVVAVVMTFVAIAAVAAQLISK